MVSIYQRSIYQLGGKSVLQSRVFSVFRDECLPGYFVFFKGECSSLLIDFFLGRVHVHVPTTHEKYEYVMISVRQAGWLADCPYDAKSSMLQAGYT